METNPRTVALSSTTCIADNLVGLQIAYKWMRRRDSMMKRNSQGLDLFFTNSRSLNFIRDTEQDYNVAILRLGYEFSNDTDVVE